MKSLLSPHKISHSTGHVTFSFLRYLGGVGFLVIDTLYWLIRGPKRKQQSIRQIIRLDELFFQMVRFGVKSISIVSVVSLFLGMVLALQMAYILQQFGVQEYIASIVSVAMFRELGPLLTAIIMAGYAGASVSAEIGTMKVGEEIMALETSAINPYQFLVLPRMIAAIVMVPALTMFSNIVGIIGGGIIGVGLVGIGFPLYFDKTIQFLDPQDVITGLIKSVVFATAIIALGCYEGFQVRNGAQGVGKATTNTVVYSIIAIISLDVVFTTIFYYVL